MNSVLRSLAVHFLPALLCLLLVACGGKDSPSGDRAADRKASEPAGALGRNSPGPAIVESDGSGRAVVSDTLPYADVGDELVYGHFVFPSDMVEPLPAVIIIHEWWGLNDTIREKADRLAAQGYIVLAVDLFAGDTTDAVADARRLMLRVVEDQDAAADNIRQAYDFVANTAGAPSVATLGWGLGGSWALNAAMLLPGELDATVIYYGQVSDDAERLQAIDTPLLGFFGEADRGVAVDDVRAFEEAMQLLGKPVDIEVYPDAGTGFANPGGRNYDESLTRQSWMRTLDFLSEALAEGS